MIKADIILGYLILSVINSIVPLILALVFSVPFWGILLIAAIIPLTTFLVLCLTRCSALSKTLAVRY
jgi:hypothetical protein